MIYRYILVIYSSTNIVNHFQNFNQKQSELRNAKNYLDSRQLSLEKEEEKTQNILLQINNIMFYFLVLVMVLFMIYSCFSVILFTKSIYGIYNKGNPNSQFGFLLGLRQMFTSQPKKKFKTKQKGKGSASNKKKKKGTK